MNYDVLIVGTGIAGLYTALNLRDDIRILMITKNTFKDCNSYLAQGGISTSLGIFDEENYFNDTMKAGNYHNDTEAVKLLIKNSIENINNLVEIGVPFDKDNDNLKYTREGGHSKFRIVHVKDETGKYVTETLLNIVSKKNNITMLENTKLVDLICKNNNCYGGVIEHNSVVSTVNSKFTILATGGIGGIFNSTTNIEYLTGDGLNISLKNNIEIKDMEYLQLHPTVLYEPKSKGKKLLLSESLRGEGGIILNQNKDEFIDSLLPRDIVSSAILKEIENTPNKPYVYLDMTKKSKEFLMGRFPFLYNECLKRGFEMDKDLLPIAPAHHYCMGGIKVDLFSRTSMNNLYAVGEASCTGVHGSNRLASNSLLEALVFSKQAAENINSKISEIDFKEIINNLTSYALDSYDELINYLKGKVDNRYAKLFNC
ncbi:L-aspartate oxidase [Clostridium sp. K12(2020)]|uniref:L-aspartate oxidase n=1 Tax=Clostridium TaxID=1485 RepID=UPI001C8B5FA5|nr:MULTISPECIES: L-aspartate oxidase [unclassified Clostridium]MBX9137665.1 L-aspartate oxidase [Clostridium sp. K12(2020)]MBX9144475.1 L-aspartate oxidase [Clostridium sp. K13]MDU2289660.1 L-aspartate oxidase [Clostridium celatum]